MKQEYVQTINDTSTGKRPDLVQAANEGHEENICNVGNNSL